MNDLGLIVSMGVNVVALYAAFRKTRTSAKAADAKAEGEIEDAAITRWQAFAARLEAKIDVLEREAEAARTRELACVEKAARQEERIDHLTQSVRALRADLKRAGIGPGPDTHNPLKE